MIQCFYYTTLTFLKYRDRPLSMYFHEIVGKETDVSFKTILFYPVFFYPD